MTMVEEENRWVSFQIAYHRILSPRLIQDNIEFEDNIESAKFDKKG